MFKKKDRSSRRSEKKSDSKSLGGLQFAKMALGGAARLRSKSDKVNKLNVFPVPDGDTGDNMRMTIESGIAALENIDSDDLSNVMKTLSHGMLLGARGNSGVILSQFFAGIADGLDNAEQADVATLGRAFELGVRRAYDSVVTPTEGTILTVARESVEYAVQNINDLTTVRGFFADLVKEMKASLDRTPEILAVLKEAGVVDSGGAGLYYIIDGFNRVLNGEEIASTQPPDERERAAQQVATTSFGADSEMKYGYCTELLLQLQNRKTDVENFDAETIKAFASSVGDSVVAFKTGSVVKLHVHTFTPERVLEYCRGYGEFLTVKIENMSLQHTSLENGAANGDAQGQDAANPAEDANGASASDKGAEPRGEKKKYGVVAVCNGDGIEALFTDLGCDVCVAGGQTQNPSTSDFLQAFDKVNAENIFVFPNNGNIIMAAQQAAELYSGAVVRVVPSKNVGTGYVALSSIDREAKSPDDIMSAVGAAMAGVETGYVSPAIREADINGLHIENGGAIGIVGKEIVVSEHDKMQAAKGLVRKMLAGGDKFMLTVFCGKGATDEERDELQRSLRDEFADVEAYFANGGQDIYPFIFVAE